MKKFILMFLAVMPLFAEEIALPASSMKNSYIIENPAYKLGFAENFGIPVWEMHALSSEMLYGKADDIGPWKPDNRVKGYTISLKDIEGAKLAAVQLYPRTHAKNSYDNQVSSYFISNLVFMNPQLRDYVWDRINQSFEVIVSKYGKAYVYSGPIFNKEVLKVKYMMNNKVAIPTHFYKIVLYYDNGKPYCKAYKIQNRVPNDYERNCDIEEFSCNLYQIEADTGIDFFDRDIDGNFRQEKLKYLEKKVK